MTNCREQRTIDWYTERFEREYKDARTEYIRLLDLFQEVCWYNFETQCKLWKGPWRRSDWDSDIELLGMRFQRKWSRGCLMEHGHFPVWYAGPIGKAPLLPPQIILQELQSAKEYMEACETQQSAATDWAPGGPLFAKLARQTLVGKPGPTSECVYIPADKKRKFSSC